MRLDTIELRGVTRFRDPYTLDLRELGRLVALVGPNGHGKTTVLEAAVGALFKRFPSRPGALYDWCHGSDAYVEATFSADVTGFSAERYRVQVKVDADHRTAEQYVFRCRDGSLWESLTTGRSREHLAVVEQLFGSEALLLASVFAAQTKTGSFLTLSKSERKAMLIEMLGLLHLEALALAARDHAGVVERAVEDLGRQREALDAVERQRARLSFELQVAVGAAEMGGLALEALRRELEEAKAAEAATAEARAALARAREAERAAASRAAKARADYNARRAAIDKRTAAAGRRRLQVMSEHQDRSAYLAERQRTAGDLLARAAAVRAAAEVVERFGAAKMAHAVAMAERDQALAEARGAARTTSALSDAAAATVLEKRSRLADTEKLWASAEAAPCMSAGEWLPQARDYSVGPAINLRGECPLLSDMRAAEDAVPAARKALEAAEAERQDRKREAHLATQKLNALQAQKLAEPAGPSDDEVRLAALLPKLEGAEQAARQVEQDLADADRAYAVRILELDQETAAVAEESANLSDADVEGAEGEVEAAREDVERLAAQLAGPGADVHGARLRLEAAEAEQRKADAEVVRLQTLESQATAQIADREAVIRGHAAAVDDAREWGILATGLGKDGVQALEIDAAGPEVAAICNELLTVWPGGPRFTLSFETLREKRSKPGETIEAFDILVLDGGAPRPVEGLSGGEKVVISEALGLGLAIYNARKNDVRWRTLVRDETAGALDPVAAQAYVDMLRRALDLGAFEQVLFVSHSPEVWQRADSVVRL